MTEVGMARADATRDPQIHVPREWISRDVDLLGRALCSVLIEQIGTAFCDLEEEVRELTKRIRGGDSEAIARLDEVVPALSVDEAEGLIRAFKHYIQLTNLAE